MINLLKYEFRKFIYNKKNLIVIIAMITFLSGFIAYNNHLDKEYPNTRIDELRKISDYANKTAKSISITISNLTDEAQKESLEEQKTFWNDLNNYSLLLLGDYTYGKYQSVSSIKTDAKWNKLVLTGMEKGYDLNNVTKDSKKTIQESLSKKMYILEKNIDIPHSPYECDFLNLFNLVFSEYIPLILIFFFLLMIFDIGTIEFENGSYKSLYSSEYSGTIIIISKMLFSVFLSLLYISMIAIIFAFAGMIFGYGSPSFPYPVYPEIFQLAYMVILMLMLYFIALTTLSILVLFISYNTYSSSVALVTMITCYMMIIVFQQIFNFKWLYPYIPFCYPFNKEIIQAKGSIICVSLGIVIMSILGFFSIRKIKKCDFIV